MKHLPRARGPWALDSGGFTEISINGRWGIGAREYAAEVDRYKEEIGQLEWAAPQDWMCEPSMLSKTGLSVEEHQRRTVANYLELQAIAPDLPWIPVLQGWSVDDYRRHADAYDRAGVGLAGLALVGLGTVCRRQDTDTSEWLIRWLSWQGVKLHGFGFKVRGLRRSAAMLESADSMAWSYRARREGRRLCRSGRHRACASCFEWAMMWREGVA